jgi:putative transposase
MTMARAQLVDVSLARWYHCVTRCVRRAFLLGEGNHKRKEWIENRLEELSDIFAVAVGGFSVMDGHGRLHRPALSPGKGLDLGGAGRHLRAARV